jgi:hypothetical protein
VKILQIGLGRWGKNHLKALKALCDELYAVDVDPGQLPCGEGLLLAHC